VQSCSREAACCFHLLLRLSSYLFVVNFGMIACDTISFTFLIVGANGVGGFTGLVFSRFLCVSVLALGLTQKELADLAGLPQRTIQYHEQ
jgi:hypothetical protein